MLDIEFPSGTSTEHLPHTRLWSFEHAVDVTPALRGFTGQCGQLTGRHMAPSECLREGTDSEAGLPGNHSSAVLVPDKPLGFPCPSVLVCTMG